MLNSSRKVGEQPVGKWPHSWSGFTAVDWRYLISTSSGPNPVQGFSKNLHNSLLLRDPNGRIDSIELPQQQEVELGESRAGDGSCYS